MLLNWDIVAEFQENTHYFDLKIVIDSMKFLSSKPSNYQT